MSYTYEQIVKLPEQEALAAIIQASTGKQIKLELFDIDKPRPYYVPELCGCFNTTVAITAKPKAEMFYGSSMINYQRHTGAKMFKILGIADPILLDTEQGALNTHDLIEVFNQTFGTALVKEDILKETIGPFPDEGMLPITFTFRPDHYVFLGDATVLLKKRVQDTGNAYPPGDDPCDC